MRILVRHGHFAFYPQDAEDLARFQWFLGGLILTPVDDYYTFPTLALADRYSLIVQPYVNLPAIVTCERREPWEVMKANKFVYHLATGLLIPSIAVIDVVDLKEQTFFYTYGSILQPGSRTFTGAQVLGYDAQYDFRMGYMKLLSVRYE